MILSLLFSAFLILCNFRPHLALAKAGQLLPFMQKTLVVLLMLMGVGAVRANAPAAGPSITKVGTKFVNTYYITDSTGALVPSSVEDAGLDNDTIRVFRTGFKWFGKTNCTELRGTSRHDTNYLSFAKNGDVFIRSIQDTVWTRLEFSLPEGQVKHYTMPDEIVNAWQEQYTMFHLRDVKALGHDTASIVGKVYDCIKYQMVETRVFEGKEYINAFTYWYSPELGYWVRLNFGWGEKYFLNQQIVAWE